MASSSWLQEIEGAVRAPTGDGGRVAASWILPAEWARLGVLERAEPIQRLEPSLPYQFALRAYVRRRLGSAAQSDEDLRAAIDSLSSTNLRFRSWHVRDVAQIPARYGNPDAVPEILAWIDRVGGRGAHFLTIVAPDLARMGFGRQIADRVARFLADPMLAFAVEALAASGCALEDETWLRRAFDDVMRGETFPQAHTLPSILRAASLPLVRVLSKDLERRPAWAGEDAREGRSWMRARAVAAERLLIAGEASLSQVALALERCWGETGEMRWRGLGDWISVVANARGPDRADAARLLVATSERLLLGNDLTFPNDAIVLGWILSALCRLGDAGQMRRISLDALAHADRECEHLRGEFTWLFTVPGSAVRHASHHRVDLTREAAACIERIASRKPSPIGNVGHQRDAELSVSEAAYRLGRKDARPPFPLDVSERFQSMETASHALRLARFLRPDHRSRLLERVLLSMRGWVEDGFWLRDNTMIDLIVDALDEDSAGTS